MQPPKRCADSCRFSGRHLISCADDGRMRVWDLGSGGRCCRTVDNPHDELGRSRFCESADRTSCCALKLTASPQ